MIKADQPTCFPGDIIVAVSSKDDGTMLNRQIDIHHTDIIENRKRFCEQIKVDYSDVVYQEIIYNNLQTYDQLIEVTEDDTTRYIPGIHADALFTSKPSVGLFLPVADCVATVMYDSKCHNLALLHLGRHSTVTPLIDKAIEHFTAHGSAADNLVVWMSPAAGKESYRLDWFDQKDDSNWQGYYTKNDEGYFLDLVGYNTQRCIENGVTPSNITVSSIDTAHDPNYYSHMTGDVAGRVAVLAMMR